MLKKTLPSIITSGTALLALLVGQVLSQESDNGVSYKLQYFHDNNLVDVLTNTIAAALRLGEHGHANVNYLVDAITGASRTDIHGSQIGPDGITGASIKSPSVDGITSASETGEKRRQISAGFSYARDFIQWLRGNGGANDNPTTLSITGINGVENDYTSRTLSAGISQDLLERNTTLAASVSRSFDQYRPAPRFIPSSSDEGWNYLGDGRRLTDHVDLAFTQGITTTTVASVLVGWSYDQGYLSRPYYTYLISDSTAVPDDSGGGGIYYHENLPATKSAMTISGKLNQYIPLLKGCSLHATYRYYDDAWALKSHTIELELYARVLDHFIIRPAGRLYTQSSAFFYQDVYTMPMLYMTTDFKYRESMTASLGLKLIWELDDFIKPQGVPFFGLYPTSLDIAADYYRRTGHAR